MNRFYGIDKVINRPSKFNLPEKSLNLLLRRADWRFLMSNPNPEVSMCFTGGELGDATRMISEYTYEYNPFHSSNECDLVVLEDPTLEMLRVARTVLRSGGCCYIEWNLGPLSNPNNLRYLLQSSGFDEIVLYLPKPSPKYALTYQWIPFQDSRVINYLVYSGLKSGSSVRIFVKNFVRMVLYLFPFIISRFPWLIVRESKKVTISSVCYKSDCSNIPNSKSSFEMCNSNNLANEFSSVYKNDQLKSKIASMKEFNNTSEISFLMATSGTSIYNKAILLVFSTKQNKPSLVIKRSRISESAYHLTNEANVLSSLQQKAININGIPKLLFFTEHNRDCTIGESIINGKQIANALNKKNYRDLARKATNFQIQLAEKTRIAAPKEWHDQLIKPVTSYFKKSFGPFLDPCKVEKTNEILDNLKITHLVCEHRDFSPWNILVNTDNEIGVIDWEGSILLGLPAVDLIFFLTYLTAHLDGEWELKKLSNSYHRILDEKSFEGEIFNECLTHYCSCIGFPKSSLPTIRLYTWVNEMNWSYYALGNYSEYSPDPKTPKNIVHISLWEEELNRLQ